MYHLAIRQFARTLRNLDVILGKAVDHAQQRGFDVNNFFGVRLFPNMLPFASQIRIACDSAKAAAAWLAGKEAPRHEDNETNIAELRARIAKTVAYLETFQESDFARTTPDMLIKLPNRPGKALQANEFLFARQIPNFFFHVTTTYAMLRQGGVDLGKADYLGTLDLRDA